MVYRRLLTEIGMGIDLIGRDVNESVKRAINDIVHRVCIMYFREKGISFSQVKLIVDIYTPYPYRISREKVADFLPVKPSELVVNVYNGGALVKGLDEIIVSIVAITILIPEE
ncbi:MAG: Lin0512 family protein [Staphylothermus sp.]|nr:Lin0512 family protein [Staphylothermus sp.]